MNLICGINPVLEALSAGARHFDRLLIVKGMRNRRVAEAIRRASELGISLRFEARETLDHMAGDVPHQGLIAVVSSKPTLDLHTLLEQSRTPGLFVVLDGIEDPRNLGAILRTADGAGVDGVLLPDRHSAGLTETVARTSAGGLEHVRVARIGNVVQALQELKERGCWVVGFDAAGAERWDAVDYRRPIAIVLGGEGRGIRRLVREHCDHLVSLPLFGQVSSLNVSVAAGIALYEVVRQRGTVPSRVRPIPQVPKDAVRQVIGPAADDAEQDPGFIGGSHLDAVFEVEEEDEGAYHVLNAEDEVANGGPTVLKAHGFSRDSHRGKFRGRPRRPRDSRDARPAAQAPPLATPPDGAEGAPKKKHRRRRRRGPNPGGPDRQPGNAPPSPSLSMPTSTTEAPAAPAEGVGPSSRPRHRRHRRRR